VRLCKGTDLPRERTALEKESLGSTSRTIRSGRWRSGSGTFVTAYSGDLKDDRSMASASLWRSRHRQPDRGDEGEGHDGGGHLETFQVRSRWSSSAPVRAEPPDVERRRDLLVAGRIDHRG